ncbi:MAG: hypothetical protein IPM26_03370 [Saprospiraceae bacterium]|nr:hypothetical protein [Saprospiraceae bacterium]
MYPTNETLHLLNTKHSLSEIYRHYTDRHSFPFGELPQFNAYPLIVVIPSYNEESVLEVIHSLQNLKDKDIRTLVIIVFNASQNDNDFVRETNITAAEEARQYTENCNFPAFHILEYNYLPSKTAGVGLARKIGMDFAIQILSQHNMDGIICCLDADSLVDCNYTSAIYEGFANNPHWDAASIYFEHPTSGEKFSPAIYESIIQYELHLRYYIRIQKWIGLPFAYQTVGSSMAVRASSYCKYGGMNTRKAGEDFYFLQKIISKGTCGEIINTKVIPSPRISGRVPFGTGRAVGDMVQSGKNHFLTYHPEAFIEVKNWIDHMEEWYSKDWEYSDMPGHLSKWLRIENFNAALEEIKRHTSGYPSFRKRIFQWFDAFRLMKYLHWYRDHVQSNIPVEEAAGWLLIRQNYSIQNPDVDLLLQILRDLDKESA